MENGGAPGRVLVVDDSPIAVEWLESLLRAEGCEGKGALSRADVISLAETWQPEVVVCDLHMPDLDGLELLRRFRKVDPDIPLIMNSSDVSASAVLDAVHEGVYDYVTKSGDACDLLAAVRRAVGHLRALRENQRLSRELRLANTELERRVDERTAQLTAANRELQKVMGQLVASERLAAIGQLAAGIAHEINNPLSYVMTNLAYIHTRLEELQRVMGSIPGAVEALATRRRGSQGRSLLQELEQALTEAEDGTTRIADIVRDVRTMSRTDDRARARFDVNATIRSATRIAGEQIRRRARLKLDLAPNVEAQGSAGRMTQVFVNLLVNAAQAIEEAPNGGNDIVVTSRRMGDRIAVEVADNGPGIAPEHLAHLFEPFFTTKPEGKGTGLGLCISHEIVQRHGGRIHVDSQPGAGTKFTVELPAAVAGAGGMSSGARQRQV